MPSTATTFAFASRTRHNSSSPPGITAHTTRPMVSTLGALTMPNAPRRGSPSRTKVADGAAAAHCPIARNDSNRQEIAHNAMSSTEPSG